APLFLGFESRDKDDSLCLPKIPSITIHSIFAYGKLKSLTNQTLNCVINAFDFPLIRAAFSLQDKDARVVDWSDKVDQEIKFNAWREIQDDSLCLPKIPSITIHSIFAYGKLKSLTNQTLNCVINAFDFPLIRAAFSLQDKDARVVDWSDKVDQEIKFNAWREIQ
nr:hypothetical protein [Tanacetum cinerariifolium]